MQVLVATALAAGLALASAPAGAVSVEFLAKFTAADGVQDDFFGTSAALDGTTALVGAPSTSGGGPDGSGDGSAYLFDTVSGRQRAKLTVAEGEARALFGDSVAVDGTTALVGAIRDDDKGLASGAAYLFDTRTGAQLSKLTASDGEFGDSFGQSVALDGTTALVGASGDDNANGTNAGAAYLFDTGTGRQFAKVTAADGDERDQFGNSVALDGTTALVGARSDDNASGAAYLFDTGTGRQFAKLTAADGDERDQFGISVALDGTTALVGASGADNFNGAAYVFDTITGQQVAKLTAADGEVRDNFGTSVALDGTTALVGMPRDGEGFGKRGRFSGSAYLFDTRSGRQLVKLIAPDSAPNELFGSSVAISGDLLLIGAERADVEGRNRQGAAYLFRLTDEPAVIPLPAAAWLMLAGLGSLAALRRRR